jgi:hypothetical protein
VTDPAPAPRREEAAAPEISGGWQPMSTAPRDGTVIVARSSRAPHYHVVAYDASPPTAWVADTGDYIITDPAELAAWAHLPGPSDGRGSVAARQVRGSGLLLRAVVLIGAGFLGMWAENIFDLLP